jgi:hypothetical protein
MSFVLQQTASTFSVTDTMLCLTLLARASLYVERHSSDIKQFPNITISLGLVILNITSSLREVGECPRTWSQSMEQAGEEGRR